MNRNILLIMALTVCVSGLAQPKGPRPASPKDKEKTEEKKEAPALNLTFSEGLFGAAQNEKDWYLEIPDSLLGRRVCKQYGDKELSDALVNKLLSLVPACTAARK